MIQTRPSGTPLISDAEALVTQELTEIDQRGRLHLLPRWANKTDWLPLPPTTSTNALMVLTEPGRLLLMSWEPEGPRIIQRYHELMNAQDGADFEALRLLQDRYRKLLISTERRPPLGDAALQHLGLPARGEAISSVYIVTLLNRIEVLAPPYRNTRNSQGHSALDDLP